MTLLIEWLYNLLENSLITLIFILRYISLTATSIESEDADRFIRESNLSIIQQYVEDNIDDPDEKVRDVILHDNNIFLTVFR